MTWVDIEWKPLVNHSTPTFQLHKIYKPKILVKDIQRQTLGYMVFFESRDIYDSNEIVFVTFNLFNAIQSSLFKIHPPLTKDFVFAPGDIKIKNK